MQSDDIPSRVRSAAITLAELTKTIASISADVTACDAQAFIRAAANPDAPHGRGLDRVNELTAALDKCTEETKRLAGVVCNRTESIAREAPPCRS
jgi:hypothetical protein